MIPEAELKILIIKFCKIFNYQCVVNGSAADYLNVNYKQVDDIDLSVPEDVYFNNSRILKNSKLSKLVKYNYVHKYFYQKYKLDISLDSPDLTDKSIKKHSLLFDNVFYEILVFNDFTRYEQLKTHLGRITPGADTSEVHRFSPDILAYKREKILKRLSLYELLFNSSSSKNI